MKRKLLAHAAIVLSGMILVFLVIDRFNSAMEFVDNPITKWLMGILCGISIYNGATLLRRRKRRRG